jgi:uncharacterized protein YeaO (DUF488 family)
MMTTSAQKSSPATERDSPNMTRATHTDTCGHPRLGSKRAYEAADDRDGIRVLVDRLWPRGVSKDTAHLDAWMKDLGPSDELRTWFGHRPDRWNSFQQRYQEELRAPLRQLLLAELQSVARRSTLTLVYGARHTSENEAVVIRNYLLGNRPEFDQSWDGARSLLATIGAVAAAHARAQATSSTLRLFVTPHLTDRNLETALQALRSNGMVRESSDGWHLTSQATKHVRQLSDPV